MKSTAKRAIVTIITLVLTATLFAGCTSPDTPAATGKPAATGSSAQNATEAPADESATEVPATEAPATEAPKTEITDGMMLYYEDFSSYEDMAGAIRIASKLGWKILYTGIDGAHGEWTADLAIKDGKLVVNNYWPEQNKSGDDGYIEMLDNDYMKRVWEHGTYTLQYDVTYTGAANYKRYINIITEYSANTYNSFHFRIAGYGNNQIRYQNQWYTYDIKDTQDLFAAQKTTGDGLTTIAYKLLGNEAALNEEAAIDTFKDITVTIRIVRSKTFVAVYMKTAEMTDFVQVSVSSSESEGSKFMTSNEGCSVVFKTGGGINGYVDNIAIWTGSGEMPEDHTVNFVP